MSTGTGFARLKVSLTSTGSVSRSAIAGWQTLEMATGQNAIGISLVRPARFASRATGLTTDGTLGCAAGGYGSLAASQSGTSLFTEFGANAGALEGHRFDVMPPQFHETAPLLSLSSAHNTLPSLGSVTNGTAFVMREHWTLACAFPIGSFTATSSPGTADRVQMYSGTAWETYWACAFGGSPRWVALNDSQLDDAGGRIISPGEGCFVQRRGSALGIVLTGEVRQNRFVQPLRAGYQLLAEGFPIPASAINRQLDVTSGFVAGQSPSSSDVFQLWSGTGYQPFFLAGLPDGSERWVTQTDANLTDRSSEWLFQPTRAAFLRCSVAKPGYSYGPPIIEPFFGP